MFFLFRGERQNHGDDIGENCFPYNIGNSYTFGKGMELICLQVLMYYVQDNVVKLDVWLE